MFLGFASAFINMQRLVRTTTSAKLVPIRMPVCVLAMAGPDLLSAFLHSEGPVVCLNTYHGKCTHAWW